MEKHVPTAVIHQALEEACPGMHVGAIRHLGDGGSSSQWVADSDEGLLLVKVPARDPVPARIRSMIAATRAAAEHGLPVVRFRAFVPTSTALQGPVLVQEFRTGRPASALWPKLDADARCELVSDLGALTARLHAIDGPWFGSPLGTTKHADVGTYLVAEVTGLLDHLPADVVEAGRDHLEAALVDAISEIGTHGAAVTPSLVHGDLWMENVLVEDGRIAALLDFQHAHWGDRFHELSALDEHVFADFLPGREVFLAAYDEVTPLGNDWEQRIALGHAVHALKMCVRTRRWAPDRFGDYSAELEAWLAEQ